MTIFGGLSITGKKFIFIVAIFILTILPLSGLLPQPTEASPDWWDTDWQYRMKLTFDNTASSKNLDNLSVLVHLTSTHSDFWSHVNSNITTDDTKDLRFVDADDSAELYFEAESIDYAGEDALIWVKVPQLDAGSATDFVYIYYGNPAATQSAYHSASDVWDTNFKLVQHLEETSGTHYDSTSNDNDGTPQNGVTQDATGKVNGAADFASEWSYHKDSKYDWEFHNKKRVFLVNEL